MYVVDTSKLILHAWDHQPRVLFETSVVIYEEVGSFTKDLNYRSYKYTHLIYVNAKKYILITLILVLRGYQLLEHRAIINTTTYSPLDGVNSFFIYAKTKRVFCSVSLTSPTPNLNSQQYILFCISISAHLPPCPACACMYVPPYSLGLLQLLLPLAGCQLYIYCHNNLQALRYC